MEEHSCIRCGEDGDAMTLSKCRMCFKYFCDDCAHKARGAQFCSVPCGNYFMHGDEDDFESLSR